MWMSSSRMTSLRAAWAAPGRPSRRPRVSRAASRCRRRDRMGAGYSQCGGEWDDSHSEPGRRRSGRRWGMLEGREAHIASAVVELEGNVRRCCPCPGELRSSIAGKASLTTFSDFDLPAAVLAELAAQGFTAPFPIQSATLPDTLRGRDVLGRGRTGSGKTLAFSLPLVSRLAGETSRRRRPRGLVLVPTRELATQVEAVIAPLARAVGLRATTVFGGVSQARQVRALDAGVDIVVACPGRLEDLIGQGAVDLGDVEITVLDEADHMADLGFLPGVRRIMDRTPPS